MKEQWRKFLKNYAWYWSYGTVPDLVERLAKAIDREDEGLYNELEHKLLMKGVIIDENGDLCLLHNLIL